MEMKEGCYQTIGDGDTDNEGVDDKLATFASNTCIEPPPNGCYHGNRRFYPHGRPTNKVDHNYSNQW